MKITIESTDLIIEGVGRVWDGITAGGVNCKVVVAAIANESDADLKAIQPELADLRHLGDCEIGIIEIHKPGNNAKN